MTQQVEVVRARAQQLAALLAQSQALTQEASGVLDTYRRKLREVDRIVQPVSGRANSIIHVSETLREARHRVEEVQENLDTATQVENDIVMGPSKDFNAFFRAIERLEKSINFLQNHSTITTSEAVVAKSLRLREMGIKMSLDYFSQLLRQHTTVPNSVMWKDTRELGGVSAAAQTAELELMSPPVTKRLGRLSELLLRNDEQRCVSVWREARRGVWDKVVSGLGEENVVKDPQVSWGVLQDKIQNWIMGMRVASHMLLPERQLSATVFAEPTASAAYYGVVEPSLRALLSLGAAITQATRRLWEKVFGLLDMHEHLQDVLPGVAAALDGAKMEKVLYAFVQLDRDLQADCRATFEEFTAELQRPNAKDITPDGSVHRLCVYTLTYLKRLSSYDSAIPILYSNGQTHDVMDRAAADAAAQDPRLYERCVARTRQVLEVLIASMEARAKSYKSKALGCLFTMNNLHHVVTRVEKSEALNCVGEDWIEAQKDAVERQGVEYLEAAWGPLIQIVSQEPARLGKEKVKDALKQLSTRIEEISAHETHWQIPDELLRENLRDVIVEDFVKPYEAYLHKFEVAFPNKVSKYTRYMKYNAADMRMIIFHKLFMGEQDSRFAHTESLLHTVGQ